MTNPLRLLSDVRLMWGCGLYEISKTLSAIMLADLSKKFPDKSPAAGRERQINLYL